MINKRHGDFTSRDLRLMELIASQLAVSVHNAYLYQELRRQYQTLERIQAWPAA